MNRIEFIKFIIDKKSLDKEVFKKSLEIDDFPIARQILNRISGNGDIEIILKSRNIVEIISAKQNFIANEVNFINDSFLKSEIGKFLDELVDLKLTNYSFSKTSISSVQTEINNSNDKNVFEENKNSQENEVEGSLFKQVLISLFLLIPLLSLFAFINQSPKNAKINNNSIIVKTSLKEGYYSSKKTEEEKRRKCKKDVENSYLHSYDYSYRGYPRHRYIFDWNNRSITIFYRYGNDECKYSGTFKLDKIYDFKDHKVQYTIEYSGNDGVLVEYKKYKNGEYRRYELCDCIRR